MKIFFQQFLVAQTPSIFAVDFGHYSWDEKQAVEFPLANGIGEELRGMWTLIDGEEDAFVFRITRHQAGLDTEEVQERIKDETKKIICPCICIDQPTIG